MAEVYLYGPTITGRLLREIQPGALEAWANSAAVAASIRARAGLASPDLHRAATWYSTSSSLRGDDNGRGEHWVAEMLAVQEDPGITESDGLRGPEPWIWPLRQAPAASRRRGRRRPTEVDPRIPSAQGGPPYPDGFYSQVAEVYLGLVALGRPPHPAIAEANGVNVSTTKRWIRRARELGLLPDAQQGKAG